MGCTIQTRSQQNFSKPMDSNQRKKNIKEKQQNKQVYIAVQKFKKSIQKKTSKLETCTTNVPTFEEDYIENLPNFGGNIKTFSQQKQSMEKIQEVENPEFQQQQQKKDDFKMEKKVSEASVQLRNQGNEVFKSLSCKIDENEKLRRIDNCITLYNEALAQAVNADEESSCLKNLSAIYYKKALAQDTNVKYKMIYLKSSLKQLDNALQKGQHREQKWKDDILQKKIMVIFEEVMDCSNSLSQQERYEILDEFFHRFPECVHQAFQAKAEFCLYYCNFLFQSAVKEFEHKNYKKAYKFMKESIQPAVVVEQCYKKLELVDQEFLELQESIHIHQFFIELVKDIEFKIEEFYKCGTESEQFDYETSLDILDFFKSVKKLSEQKQIYDNLIQEFEGTSNCMIGIILNLVIFRKNDSKLYLYAGVSQILGLGKPELQRTKWFKQAQTLYQSIQKKAQEEQEEQESKEREKRLELIKEDYEKLQKARDVGCKNFCKFIMENYSTQTMKDKDFKLNDEQFNNDKIKKSVIKLIRYYHPDKHDKNKDVKLFYLYSEITRFLNGINDLYKC